MVETNRLNIDRKVFIFECFHLRVWGDFQIEKQRKRIFICNPRETEANKGGLNLVTHHSTLISNQFTIYLVYVHTRMKSKILMFLLHKNSLQTNVRGSRKREMEQLYSRVTLVLLQKRVSYSALLLLWPHLQHDFLKLSEPNCFELLPI